MKTIKYKTLEGLFKQASELNFNDFDEGRFIHKGQGWRKFQLPEAERVKGYDMFAAAGWTERKHLYHITYYVDGNRKISTWGNSTKETIAQYLQWYNQNGFVWLNG